MRFIVCARNRSDGDTFVVGQRSYPDKDAAISALGGSPALDVLAECELFVLDLDAATPVVLVHTRQEPVLTAPAVDLDDDAADENVSAETASGVTADEEIGERLEESDLWSIVETIVDEPLDSPVIADGTPTSPWWIDAAPSEDVVQVSIYDYTDDFASEPAAEQTAVTARDDAGRDVSDAHDSETVDAHESALAAVDVQAAADESAARTEAGADASLDDLPFPGPDLAADPPIDEPIDDARLVSEPVPEIIEAPESDPGLMRVDFDAWTCVDCVFTATCERNDDDSPSDCGSFQWRPA